jgi:hypothetical protein
MALSVPLSLQAGTLDGAPFEIQLPNQEWQLSDTAARPMGQGVSLVATIRHAKAPFSSTILKTEVGNPATALEELCIGMRKSLKNPKVKIVADADTTFLGRKGRAFVYEVTLGSSFTYSMAVVFLEGKTGWTISFTGPHEKKEEVKQMASFFKARS